MAIKTILVHCNDARRAARLVAAAARLAGRLQAHLIGLSVAPPSRVLPTGMPGSPDTMDIDAAGAAYRADADTMKAAFADATAGLGISAEWCEEQAGIEGVAAPVLRYAAGADLIIAGQADASWPLSARLDIAERLAMEAARPVLIIPNDGPCPDIGTSVVIAWNGRREATRAAFDALPLLARASTVKVLTLDAMPSEASHRDFAARHLCAGLARHGITCEVVEAPSDGHVGRSLLNAAETHGADLMVMGCYGHSRLAELVLGGASRHVLTQMRVPVLMSR